ncbi:hypothetical protein ACFSC6_10420 [Rufibacter sediminis]|uniref:Uncharacterized protein n=1 Tax=Rufibacter sediminis TaxID=2762756 RepID=A0ABR6VP58_9BACT|nr:hypothetical protein [Rufibacter sediminis]MBC3538948.1 hypothetical protein [Rufibacter sediminis]
MPLTLYDFLRLGQEGRAEAVFREGEFLTSCAERGNLYHMGTFYAEVLYDGERKEVRGFRTLRNLEPYLDHLSVTGNGVGHGGTKPGSGPED